MALAYIEIVRTIDAGLAVLCWTVVVYDFTGKKLNVPVLKGQLSLIADRKSADVARKLMLSVVPLVERDTGAIGNNIDPDPPDPDLYALADRVVSDATKSAIMDTVSGVLRDQADVLFEIRCLRRLPKELLALVGYVYTGTVVVAVVSTVGTAIAILQPPAGNLASVTILAAPLLAVLLTAVVAIRLQWKEHHANEAIIVND